jgi:methylmalonyl-CoA mutase
LAAMTKSGKAAALPVPSIRAAERIEHLPDLSDAFLARTGSRPRAFLANLGPAVAFSARATFATNFFAAGGIEAITNDGFSSLESMATAFASSGAGIAYICSSDNIYFDVADAAIVPNDTAVEETMRALNREGCSQIYMDGRPIMREYALQSAGLRDFIYEGCDLVAVLNEAYRLLDSQHPSQPLAEALA